VPAAADEGAAHQYSPLCEAWGRRLLQPAQPRVRAAGAAVADRDGSSAAQQGAAAAAAWPSAAIIAARGTRYKCI
jgi:hypothetical protein